MLSNKTIIVGITGGIAAYKTCSLVSRLKAEGADVWVVMTDEATKLISPLTFRTLSKNPVITSLTDENNIHLPVPHISLSHKADLLVISPCSANTIGKMAHGIADNALTTVALSAQKVLIAPAMNNLMWENEIVQENLKKLLKTKFISIGPNHGPLACGDTNIGRMSEPDEIYEKILEILLGKKGTVPKKQDLKNISILITAGGTREPIDPVRFIGNSSSGKMGYALASAAKNRGAEVTLISGPTLIAPPEEIKLINITTAEEMREKINEEKKGKKVIIMCAAVSDYKPAITLWQKLKRENETYELKLIKTEDILADIGKNKNGTFLVGFAAESQDLINNALNKLKTKNLDLIVANDVSAMEKDESEVIIIDRSGKIEELPCLLKTEVAEKILDAILRLQMPKL